MAKTYTTQEAADLLGINYEAAAKRLSRAGLEPVRMMGANKLWSLKQIESVQKS